MGEQRQAVESTHGQVDALTVDGALESVSLVRGFARQSCRHLGWQGDVDSVLLLVSEVATNAILHAHTAQVGVRVRRRGARLRVEVSDDSHRLPVPRRAPAVAEDGRGLALVEALAAAWGVEAAPTGKTFWFEVAPGSG